VSYEVGASPRRLRKPSRKVAPNGETPGPSVGPGRLLRLQKEAGNSAVAGLIGRMQQGSLHAGEQTIQRDLTVAPPGRTAEPVPLTPDQVQTAVDYNNARYSRRSIETIQDLVGAEVTGVVDERTVHMITEWQADFRLAVDGMMGPSALQPVVEELIRLRRRNGAIWLIIDGHNMSTAALVNISYDASVAANATTSGPIPGDSTVRVGPAGFAQGYAGLVHTIAHELEHVRQRRAGMATQATREFLAEAIEILSAGMLAERFAGFIDDAGRALTNWNNMPAAEQATHWARFVRVRNRVRTRFNSASAATQAANQATMDGFNAVVAVPHGP